MTKKIKDISKFEDNIKNYSKSIVTLEGFATAVRQNPGQYIGYLRNKGFINMIREIYQNSIDELIKVKSPCDHIYVYFDENTNLVTIEDNGRGIPFGEIIRIFTTANTSSNYIKKLFEYASGLHGVGGKVVNALSSSFIVESYILGEGRRVEFEKGKPWKKGEAPIKNPKIYQGSIISFIPDYEIMEEITVTVKDVESLISKILMLAPIGSKVTFEAMGKDGSHIKKELVNEDGILTELINKTVTPLIKPIYYKDDNGTTKAEIIFTYDSSNLGGESIVAFSNFCPTIGGYHIDGFIDGLCTFFRKYMNNVYLKNSKKKLQVINADIRQGLRCVISAAHIKPIFSGQAKDILDNADMGAFVKELTMKALDNWMKSNQTDAKKLCDFFKDTAEIRLKSDTEKIKLSNKYQTSKLTNMPAKFVKPETKKGTELIIVEGDSAKGNIVTKRDPRQGIFPIRGKLPNAYNKSPKEFLANEEIAAMITLFGCGYGKTHDMSKFKWDKIIIGVDADPDGAHIRVLLLKFILLYCPGIIKEGKLYGAVPPLYGIPVKSGKKESMKYFTEKIDFIKYVQSKFSKENDLKDENGKVISKSDITYILYNNSNYVRDLENIANTFAIRPLLLEFILSNITLPISKLNFRKFKNTIEKNYRFMKVYKKNDVIIIDGLYDDKYHTIFLNQKFLDSCSILIDYINKSPINYILNGNKITLYNLMIAFDESKPKNLTRFKGLGEMNPRELFESTFDPAGDRVLIQYNIESVKETIEEMRIMNSDTRSLLNDIRVSKDDIL